MTSSSTPERLVADRYRLHAQIGGGGMGAVYLATDELLGRQVAVKQVLPPVGTDPDAAEQQRQRALREGRIAARLTHPHAISVYDVALEDGQPWLVMEYLPSRSLAAVLAEDGLLSVDQVAQIGAQVADALAATHAAGIVHRDVKPANILIGQGGRVEGLVKITDFGISHARGDVTLTQTGQITGTPAFLAPEVAQGYEMTEASDVFSLGATLYTCLEGEPPFGMDDNALRLLHHVAVGEMRPPRQAGALTAVLMRMLAADPAARPQMSEVRDSLARLAAGKTGDTTTVLMARTTLGSPAAGRPRTTTFGADDAVAGAAGMGAAVAAAGAAAGGPQRPVRSSAGSPPTRVGPSGGAVPPGQDDPSPAVPAGSASPPTGPRSAVLAPSDGGPTRRGRRGMWTAVAAALVAAAAVVTVLLLGRSDDGTDRTADPPATTSAPAPSSSQTEQSPETSPETSAETSAATSTAAETTSEAPATSTPPAEDPGVVTAAELEQALTSYHSLLPGDTESAYALTGPTLRSRVGFGSYQAFWSEFSSVQISGIQAQDGSMTPTATLTFTRPDGSTLTELHRFTMVEGENGELLVDLDQAIG